MFVLTILERCNRSSLLYVGWEAIPSADGKKESRKRLCETYMNHANFRGEGPAKRHLGL